MKKFSLILTILFASIISLSTFGQNPVLTHSKRGSVLVFPYYNTGLTSSQETFIHVTTDEAFTRTYIMFLDKVSGAFTYAAYTCLTNTTMLNAKVSDYVGHGFTGEIIIFTVDQNTKPLPASNHLSGVATFTRPINGVAKEFTYQAVSIVGFNQLDTFGNPVSPVTSVNGGAGWQVNFDGHCYQQLPSTMRFPAKNPNQNPELVASTLPIDLTWTSTWATTSIKLNVQHQFNGSITNTSRAFPVGLAFDQNVNSIGWTLSYSGSTNVANDANNMRSFTNLSNLPIFGFLLFTGFEGGNVWQAEPENLINAITIIPQFGGTTC